MTKSVLLLISRLVDGPKFMVISYPLPPLEEHLMKPHSLNLRDHLGCSRHSWTVGLYRKHSDFLFCYAKWKFDYNFFVCLFIQFVHCPCYDVAKICKKIRERKKVFSSSFVSFKCLVNGVTTVENFQSTDGGSLCQGVLLIY